MKKGTIRGFDWTSLILPAVVLGGAYFLYKKFLGDGSGTGQNNESIDQGQIATSAASTAAAAKAGSKQTITDSALNALANSLYYKLTNNGDQSDIVNSVVQVNTWADWERLVTLYGTKQVNADDSVLSACALLGIGCQSMDLGTTLRLVLNEEHKTNLNTYFSDMRIPVTI